MSSFVFEPQSEPRLEELRIAMQSFVDSAALRGEDKALRAQYDRLLKDLLSLLKDKQLLRELKKATSMEQVRAQNVFLLKQVLQQIADHGQRLKKEAEQRNQVFNKATLGVQQQLAVRARLERVKPPLFYLNGFLIERVNGVIRLRQLKIALGDIQKRIERIELKQRALLELQRMLRKKKLKLREVAAVMRVDDMAGLRQPAPEQ